MLSGAHGLRVQYTFSAICGPSSCLDVGGDKVNVVSPTIPLSSGGVLAAPIAPLTFDGKRDFTQVLGLDSHTVTKGRV